MDPAEAFAAIPLAAVCCDRNFNRQEARVLQHQLQGRWPYREMTAVALGELLHGLLGRLRQEGWEGLIQEAAAALTPQQQETAFAIAAQLNFCDREVTAEEQRFLSQLAEVLLLPPGRARQVVEVLHLLNQDALRPRPSQAASAS
jgi:hypothetical protein